MRLDPPPEVGRPADLADRVRQLEKALESRTLIARAQGMLMERYTLDADAAFAVLARTSNELNVKVRDIAAVMVETRRLPRAGEPVVEVPPPRSDGTPEAGAPEPT